MKEMAKNFPSRSSVELPVHATTMVAFPDGEECIIIMSRAHSMFMNCVPLMKNQLGADMLEKIRLTIHNMLFKSVKFYPKPNHADAVVGLCLYDCNYHVPGLEGDFT